MVRELLGGTAEQGGPAVQIGTPRVGLPACHCHACISELFALHAPPVDRLFERTAQM